MLCPIDFSDQSRLALRYAEEIARRGNARLVAVYANDKLLVAAAAAVLHDRHIEKRTAIELRNFVHSTLAAGSIERLTVKCYSSTGVAPDEIIKAARRHRADLIVLGTHGRGGADRLLLGSTTLSVLQRSVVPVLAVPDRAQVPAPTDLTSWPGERIVAALELDGGSAREAETAARVAQWLGVSLLLLHVVSEVAAPDWLAGDLSAHDRIRLAQAHERIDAIADDVRRRVPTSTRVVCGRIAEEIAALAATERVTLLLTALRDRRGWLGARRGSVSYQLLSHGVAPVLACPQEWRA